MIDDARVFEILTEICEDVTAKRSKRGFVARCPVCGDSKKTKRIRRLHVDYYSKHDDFAVTCYNGGCPFHSGNVYSLYAAVKGVSYGDARKYIEEDVYDPKAITKALSASKPKPAKVEILAQDGIDLEWSDVLTETQEVTDRFEERYQAALSKFISDRQIPSPYKEEMVVAFQGRYQGRVIIPIYLNGKLMYFQGRSLFDNIEPKYLNPDVDKDMIVSNSDSFSRDKYIVVVEGLIDSWMVEDNQGTSVNGGYFNDDLIEYLLTLTDKGVILCPDNPFLDSAGRLELIRFMKESKYAGIVKYFIMAGAYKDLNILKVAKPDYNIYQYIVAKSGDKWYTEMQLGVSIW